jgi:hypothetical protein
MSDCSCVYVGDDDTCEFSFARTVKAAKDHKCCECGGIIVRGTMHHLAGGKWDGDFSTFRTCPVCREIIKAFFCNGYAFGAIYDDLWQHRRDIGGNVKGECLSGLSAPAREKVCEMIEDVWSKCP